MSWKQIVVTSDDSDKSCNCHVRDLETHKEITKFRSGNSRSRCLSFICDDYLITSLSGQKALNVWSLTKSHKAEHRIDCVGHVLALAVSPKGNHCVGAIGSKLYVWQIVSGDLLCILTDHYQDVNCIKFSDNGKYFISGAEDSLALCWDLGLVIESRSENPKPMHVWRDHAVGITDIHVGYVSQQAKVATVSRDKMCKIFELFSGKCIYTVYTEEMLYSVTMDRLEHHLFLGTGSGIIIQTAMPSECSEKSITIKENHNTVFKGHRDAVTCLSVSFDSLHLLSGSNDATAILWLISSHHSCCRFEHQGPVTNAIIKLCPQSLLSPQNAPRKMQIQPFSFSTLIETDAYEISLKPHYLHTKPVIEDNECYEEFDSAMEIDIPVTTEELEAEMSKTSKANRDIYLKAVDTVLKQWSGQKLMCE